LAKNPGGHDLAFRLRSLLLNLQEHGLLGDEVACHIHFLSSRMQILNKEDDTWLLRARIARTGISGQPLAQHLQQLDISSGDLMRASSEIQSTVCLLRKTGLLDELEASEHLQYLSNRASELEDVRNARRCKVQGSRHQGVSSQEIHQKVKSLHRVAENFMTLISHLHSAVRMIHALGFLDNEEEAEYLESLDQQAAGLVQIRKRIGKICKIPKRSTSLPQ
jgi:hypothetical protein